MPKPPRSYPIPNPASSSRLFTPDRLPAAWRALARVDFAFYCQYVHRGHWKRSKHLELTCNYLEAIERGDILRLILSMPPRHGKSMTVTESFPSWCIGRNPDWRSIEVSYGDDLARGFGDRNRRKVEEFGEELFGVRLDSSARDKSDWSIAGHYGGMVSTGVGGAVTGKGADLLIIDDPIKNRQEADSETYRNRLWSEWQNTLATRLHPGARVVLVMTRWHEDDLAGRLLREHGDEWTLVNLPALAEPDDPLGRAEGEALWPERYDVAALAAIKTTVGARTFEALYQGHPSPQEGSIFRRGWWGTYPLPPAEQARNMRQIVLSWDCAFKDLETSDYVVGQVWGRRDADAFLLDQVRGRLDFPATVRAVKALAAKWPQAKAKLIEDKANGTAVIATLKREVPGLIPVEPEGGKIARANAVSPYVESGNVFLPSPQHAPWINDFIEEYASFPHGRNDDQVDAGTQALAHLYGKRAAARAVSRPAGM